MLIATFVNTKKTVWCLLGACLANTVSYVYGVVLVVVVVCLMKQCCFINSLISNIIIID